MKPALLWEPLPEGRVQCHLCAHECHIAAGEVGVCRVRKNVNGRLFSLNADRVCAVHLDPIEKKPLHHFLPGSTSFSLAAMGCNFRCRFCQNHTISMVAGEEEIQGEPWAVEVLVEQARRSGAASISYTYTEPTVFFELTAAAAELASATGLKNVMVTNGFMSPAALRLITPFLDAANVDLKSFSDSFYRTWCRGRLQPVCDTIQAMRAAGVWVEVTTLLIPGLNDDPEEIRRLAEFLVSVDPAMPWHVSRFFPQHELTDRPVTPLAAVERSLEIGAAAGLHHLYGGNIPDGRWSATHCRSCRAVLISRRGYSIRLEALHEGRCRECGAPAAGVWD